MSPIKTRFIYLLALEGTVYAFDSTIIELCLAVFCWARFRKKKGEIKIHTLYDVEAQVPAFFHITTASVHDFQAMKEIPVESGSYYILDRGDWSDLRLSEDGDVLYFNTETAWGRASEVEDLIREKFPSIGIYYLEEELGMGIFQTNDDGEDIPTLINRDSQEFMAQVLGYCESHAQMEIDD